MNKQNIKDSEKSIFQLRQALRKNLEAVDQEIISRLNKSIPLINDIGTHLINAAGKRLRPLLTLAMAAQFNNYSKNPILLAAAVEFIHTATLLHDDVVDESNLRRGKKTANIIWGNEFSVLAGDFLFAQSFELMVETKSVEALSSLASASCKITQGEFQQMQIANKPETSIEKYLEVIGKKTAELFGASCKSGVIVSEGNAEQQNAAYDYGFNLGLAFQIVDDLMDFNNLPNKMGKNLGDDFKLGKTTLPVILGWQKSNPKEKKFWIRTLKELNQEPNDFNNAIDILNKYNIKSKPAGNIGNSPLNLISDSNGLDYLILELSSFQLTHINKIELEMAVVLNIYQDHIDWHETFEQYVISKLKIFNFSTNQENNFLGPVDSQVKAEGILPKNVRNFNEEKFVICAFG